MTMPNRAILFDTETTGLSPQDGDRILEIAALELDNELPTGKKYHVIIDPERDIPAEATRVHGFTAEHVQGKPKFAEIAQDFLDFIQDSPLIAHNASFDMGFLNAELERINMPKLDEKRAIDTLKIARQKFPGVPASLDALCRRFGISLAGREKHNALLDCKLLAEVYLELKGGRQRGLDLKVESKVSRKNAASNALETEPRTPRPPIALTDEEVQRHDAFVATIKEALWNA